MPLPSASMRAMPLTSPAGLAAVTTKPKKTLPCASIVIGVLMKTLGVEGRRSGVVGGGAVEDDASAGRPLRRSASSLHEQLAAGARRVEAVAGRQREVVARHPVVRRQQVVGRRRPDQAAVAARRAPRCGSRPLAPVLTGRTTVLCDVIDRRAVVDEQRAAGACTAAPGRAASTSDAVQVLGRDGAVPPSAAHRVRSRTTPARRPAPRAKPAASRRCRCRRRNRRVQRRRPRPPANTAKASRSASAEMQGSATT